MLRILVLLLFCVVFHPISVVRAESTFPVITPWDEEENFSGRIERAQKKKQRQRENVQTGETPPVSITIPPSRFPLKREKEKPSALEKMYSDRIVDELKQFGYDLFGVPEPDTLEKLDHIASMPSGAVQDDFILNIGDEVEVVFSGQRTDRGIYKINNQGVLLIRDFPPIPVAGRTMGQIRISIESAARNLHNTQAYIALASVRQIGVLVVGHVKKPGRQTLTVFHTALDALMEAGGVQKTGSLRQIKLVRNGRGTIIDLYGLLIHGSTNMDFRLRDGDRIIVPSIGPTVSVAGAVKRPGIFEILPTIKGMRYQPEHASEKLSLNEMLDLGGGVLAPGQNRFLRLDVTNDGHEMVDEVHDPFTPKFGDGAILMISKGIEKRSDTVELTGHTRRGGIHALAEVPSLSKLLDNEQVLGPRSYPLIGVIERWDSDQLTSKLVGFPLLLVLKGEYDRKLQDGDVVHLFSREQIASLGKKNRDENIKPRVIAMGSTDEELEEGTLVRDPVMASFLRERFAFVRGAVRNPGAYPVAEGITLDSVLAIAGGLTLEANTGNIEVTSTMQGEGHQENGRSGTRRIRVNFRENNPQEIPIAAGDAVRVNQKFKKVEDKSVLIIGEVSHPGRYDLIPGDKVSDLIRRAGGMSSQAYPDGAIFSRESERKAEESRFRAAARDMERAIAVAIEKEEDGPDTTQIALARDLASELREVEAVGRITMEADMAVLSVSPELDMLLESGDRIYIPKRPLTVRVSGEILSPASLQFRSKKDPGDYIDEAGGFTYHADQDRTFVLYPDGSAQPLQVSSWNHKAAFIPPGSTIVVPRDPKPFDFVESAKDISQILSNLAISTIFLDNVRDN